MDKLQQNLFNSLPVLEADLTIRLWTRKDLDRLADWPGYTFPYEPLNLRFSGMNSEERDDHFRAQDAKADRVTLIVDHTAEEVIGYFALIEIDWAAGKVGNMGIRIAPAWCNKGIGTQVLCMISELCFGCGMKSLRLDSAAVNERAIRCYEKAGFIKTGEFWRDDEYLKSIDIDQPRYDFLLPHIRFDDTALQSKFWWMELKNKNRK